MNNNNQFRIKITENNKGEKWYTPQIKVFKSKLLDFIFGEMWNNIIEGQSTGFYSEEESMSQSWPSEEKALEVIKNYQEYLHNKHDKQTKSIEYKIVEL